MSDPSPGTCFGCIHQTYRGPADIEDKVEGATQDDGYYYCRLLSEPRRANKTPRPLLSRCKEIR